MSKVFLIILFTFLNLLYCRAEIIYLQQIKDLPLPKPLSKTLVVFDIDETIIVNTSMISNGTYSAKVWMQSKLKLSNDNFTKLYSHLITSNILPEEKLNIYTQICDIGDKNKKLVEKHTPFIINKLQSMGIPVIALTSRVNDDPNLWYTLNKIQIDFSKPKLLNNNDFLKKLKKPEILKASPFKPSYEKGIIFTDLANKAETLTLFLEALDFKPDSIIFVDNSLDHCLNIEETLSNKFKTQVYFYTASELQFDEKIALIQFETFKKNGVLLTDETAYTLLLKK
ncbi:MAG: DUF2608 domain-containing protein [Sphingobacteriia bacterium]|nr:DUF2608 domain-containing protein [Sphingobacteriia bacterium]